jgi:CRP-like cAMP-binding protein
MSNDVPTYLRSLPAGPTRELPAGCRHCPLRRLAVFQSIGPLELGLIEELKTAELEREAGATLIAEGQSDGPLYTLLSGWAIRYKSLGDGRRQILNIMLPGDFIGLQQKMNEAASHGVEALTEVRLCTFARDAVWTLHRELPSLGYDVTWLSAHENHLVDENLLSVGRRNAIERLGALLLSLHARALPFDPLADEAGLHFPLTQQHLADALGLSLVHTHRSLRALQRAGLYRMSGSRLQLPAPAALAALARLRWPLEVPPRPLI